MNYGKKYDHKKNKWIVYDKSTKKIISEHFTEEQANKRLRELEILDYND